MEGTTFQSLPTTMPLDQLQALDGLVLPPAQPEQKVVFTEKKRKHKLTEQKGRQKINTQITDLKNLLPECKYVTTTKASILECAVKSLQRLQALCNQLMQSNKHMQKENRRLKMELLKLSGGQINFPLDDCEESIEETGKAYNPNMAITDFSNIDSLLGSDELENFGEYQSSPNSSPPFISTSPVSYPGQSSPGSSGNEDQSPEDETAKISRRRLLLVFLFMIPFFLSMESFGALFPHPGGDASPIRALKETNEFNETAFEYYFDIARFFWYMILGTLGMTWVANTLLWMNGLGKHSNFIVKKATKVMKAIVEPERSE